MKKSPLTKIQKFHFKRPFIYACPQLKFGSLCITINEKNEILGKYHLVFKLTLTESTLRTLHWFWVEVLFRFWVTPRLNVLGVTCQSTSMCGSHDWHLWIWSQLQRRQQQQRRWRWRRWRRRRWQRRWRRRWGDANVIYFRILDALLSDSSHLLLIDNVSNTAINKKRDIIVNKYK